MSGAVVRRRDLSAWLVPSLVLLATAAAFLPSLQNGFVGYDDPENIYENPDFRGLGWTQLRWMFTTFLMAHYQPVTWLTLGLNYTLGGLEPFGYHLGNLLLHIAAALLLYLISLRLIGISLPPRPGEGALSVRLGAGLAALFFAIHPLRVESVAWATERRDSLSGMFFLLTVLAYLHACDARASTRRRWFAGVAVLHTLALLSKIVTMALPAVLILLDIFPLRRLPADPRRWREPPYRAVLDEKVPLALLSCAFAVIAPFSQAAAKSLEWTGQYNLSARLFIPLFGVAFYLLKTVAPVGLKPLYPLPTPFDATEPRIIVGSAITVGLTALFIWKRDRWPALLVVWAYYVIVLLPMLGIIQIGIQIAADRYTYLPSLGWAVLIGAAFAWLWQAAARGKVRTEAFEAGLVGAFVLVCFLGARTFNQSLIWRDTETLWRYAIGIDPQVPELHNWLGLTLKNAGRNEEAISEFKQAIRLRDGYVACRVNLGNSLAIAGDNAGALEQFEKAGSFISDNPHAQHNWGLVLIRLGRSTDALPHLEEAMRTHSEMPFTRTLLARAYLDLGRIPDALHELGLEIYYEVPASDVLDRVAETLPQPHLDEAADLLERALKVRPDAEAVRLSLVRARIRQGRQGDAAELLAQVLSKNPGSARAYRDLSKLCFGAALYRTAWEAARAGLAVSAGDEDLQKSLKAAADAETRRQRLLPQQIAALARGDAPYESLIEIAAGALEAGRSDEGRRAAQAAARARPGSPEAAWIAGISEARARDLKSLLPPTVPRT